MKRPAITHASFSWNVRSCNAEPTEACVCRPSVYDPKRTSAASAAEPIAYPFVTAFVVLPTASSWSVIVRTFSGRSAISAIPPALSVTGPNASSATMRPVMESWAITATPIP